MTDRPPAQPPDPSAPIAVVARRLLDREAGGEPSARGIADGTVAVCQKLTAHLARVLGAQGSAALLGRSASLARKGFPWLVSAPTGDDPWAELRSCLERQPPDVAHAASLELVTSFLGLVGKFIGPALVLRLLAEVWPDDVASPQDEETP